MKKYIVLLCCLILTVLVHGQGAVVRAGKNVGRAVEQATSKSLRKANPSTINGGGAVLRNQGKTAKPYVPPQTSVRNQSSTPAIKNQGTAGTPAQYSPVSSVDGQGAAAPTQPMVPLKETPLDIYEQYKQEQQANLEKEQENAQLKTALAQAKKFADFGKSVLLASSLEDPYIGFSVTVFKINVAGKEEIFGVIPSHGLARKDYLNEGIIDTDGNDFSVLITQPDGRDVFLPATLVQTSAESMLDISLVKFSPEAEKLLLPLELAPENGSLSEKVYSNGYAMGTETQVTRSINSLSLISLRANQTIEGDRAGFCGSPWLDANHRVLGIHTGSKVGIPGQEDVSFATHARFVRLLVEAYHNGGTAPWNLVLGEHNLATLNVDEYISDIALFDENGKTLMQHHFNDKFSQSVVLNALQRYPNALRIELTSRKAIWDGFWRVEDRSALDSTKRIHRYNLKTKQTEAIYQ